MKNALILQGWYQDISANWYSWLKEELEKRGYQVFLPELPTMHTDLPDMQKQIEFVEGLVDFDQELIVFGHSLGCLLGMRLAEKYKFKKLFLVAGWDFNDLTPEHRFFWPNGLDHQKIKQNVEDFYCISSDNDPYMTAFTVEQMSKRLNGKFVLVKGAGHFTDEYKINKIPEVLEYI